MPLTAGPVTYAAAMDRYLTATGISKGSARVYRISLTNWGWMVAGEPTPTEPARRGAKPAALALAALDDLVLPEVLAELAATRADELDQPVGDRRPRALSAGASALSRPHPGSPRRTSESEPALAVRS